MPHLWSHRAATNAEAIRLLDEAHRIDPGYGRATAFAAWARARYQEYRAGRVGEETMCGEMVTIHEGLDDATLAAAAARYFRAHVVGKIFPEMAELVCRLHARGCEVWAVSSTNDWVINAAAQQFEIPLDRVLAAAVYREGGRAMGVSLADIECRQHGNHCTDKLRRT